MKKRTLDLEQRVKYLTNLGVPATKIAKTYGVSRMTIHRWLKDLKAKETISIDNDGA